MIARFSSGRSRTPLLNMPRSGGSRTAPPRTRNARLALQFVSRRTAFPPQRALDGATSEDWNYLVFAVGTKRSIVFLARHVYAGHTHPPTPPSCRPHRLGIRKGRFSCGNVGREQRASLPGKYADTQRGTRQEEEGISKRYLKPARTGRLTRHCPTPSATQILEMLQS